MNNTPNVFFGKIDFLIISKTLVVVDETVLHQLENQYQMAILDEIVKQFDYIRVSTQAINER